MHIGAPSTKLGRLSLNYIGGEFIQLNDRHFSLDLNHKDRCISEWMACWWLVYQSKSQSLADT